MNINKWGLLTCILLTTINIFGQKLKKADRAIVANLQTHVKNINSDENKSLSAGSAGEKIAAEYIGQQFERLGLKPIGDSGTWYQRFTIYDGKEILAATSFAINQSKLTLHKDYFPFPFSANKSAEAAVAVALAEDDVPWFKDLRELVDNDDTVNIDTLELIRQKAILAANKGASALIIYNTTDGPDLVYDKFNNSSELTIPVIYLTKEAFKKYCADESAIVDISLNVAKRPRSRTGINVLGFANNKADSTVLTIARLDQQSDAAALIEVARLVRNAKSKNKNYLFVAVCGEAQGTTGLTHLQSRPVVDPTRVSRMVRLDTVTVANNNPKGLHLVRQSVDLIR
jgi:aminopeptidase YwaD